MTKSAATKQQQPESKAGSGGVRQSTNHINKGQLSNSKSVYPTNQQHGTPPERMKPQIDSKARGRPYPTAALMAASKLQRGPNGKFLPRNSSFDGPSQLASQGGVEKNPTQNGPCESQFGSFSSNNHGPSFSYYPGNAPGMRMC